MAVNEKTIEKLERLIANQDAEIRTLKTQLNDEKLSKDGTIRELRDRLENSVGQLQTPLDPQTNKAIRETVLLPASVRLKDTDAATAANYGMFFVADRTYEVVAITEVHGTAGSDASAVTLQIQRLQGTEAIGSGDDLLSSAFDLKGTADTVQFGTLTADKSVLVLERGDRLSLEDSGTLTAVANLQVTVLLKQI